MDEMAKALREKLRWDILNKVESQRPQPVDEAVLHVALGNPPAPDLRRALLYLRDRKLLGVDDQRKTWLLWMTRTGIDVVDYVIPCEPGIARPDANPATLAAATRGSLRWRLLVALNYGGGELVDEDVLATTIVDSGLGVTLSRVRRSVDYLERRGLVETQRGPDRWKARINRHGVDIVEYSVDCEPGIARPRAWS